MSLNNIIRNTLKEQIGGGGECETSTCNCVSSILSMGYYQANFPTNTLTWEENCWSDYGNVMGNGQTNNCAKVACKPNQGCVNIPYTDPDWATTPFVGCNAIIDCQAQYPNGCNPVDYYDCTQATGYQCDVVNYSTPHTSLGSCQTQHPNGCTPVVQQTCCDVWVCVDSGNFNKCCKSLQLCKPVGGNWGDNYPNGFPWNLVESTNVPPQEFKKILKENLLLEWMCNMDWVTHFGVWLSSTKLECQQGPPWISYQSIPGGQGCGPCNILANDLDVTKFADNELNIDKIKTTDTLKGKDAEEALIKWRDEGRVQRVNEDFYKNITRLVEDIYRTKNLLKS